MDELAEVARLRTDIPVPANDQALAVLAGAMADGGGGTKYGAARRRRVRLRILCLALAGTAAAAGAAVAALGPPGRTAQPAPPGVSSGPPVIGFRPGPSQGAARNAVELVDYATKAAAQTPIVVPGRRDWEYIDELIKSPPSTPPEGSVLVSWQQVGTDRNATLDHGKLRYGYGGGPRAQLIGWPGNWTNLYQYLATLPSSPAALRKVILANNKASPKAAFTAISALMTDFPLPPRFQAELYAVLVSLPGVHFTRSATDAAGRHGVGLYIPHLQELIINPRTYVFMGGRSGDGWSAILGSGIVSRAGQLP